MQYGAVKAADMLTHEYDKASYLCRCRAIKRMKNERNLFGACGDRKYGNGNLYN